MSGGASLGITRDSRPLSRLGRIADLDRLSPGERAAQYRLIRWQRQNVAAHILPDERVAKCFRVRLKPFVEVLYSAKVHKAHYGGLMICGSVWMCPVCAAKITERRRLELESIDTTGLSCFMVTVTLQHSTDDSLKDVLQHLTSAWSLLKSGGWWQRFVHEFLIVGNLIGTEATYGLDAGWHPHKHVLMWSRLSDRKIKTEMIRGRISERFEHILSKAGRYASPIHGVDVRKGNDLIGEYVAKFGYEPKKKDGKGWSLAAEITKGPAKIGLKYGKHYSPFQLLDLSLAGSLQAEVLFGEYALTMKGTRQLRWSPGTRDLFGLDDEMSDEEIAAMQAQTAECLALLKAEHWLIISRKEKRFHVLEVASTGNVEYFKVYLKSLGVEL
jgi:hypothetical protein